MTNSRYNHLRVHLNHLFFLALLLWPGDHLRPWAFALVLVGEALRTWSAGLLRKNEALATAGPYRFTRNPLYVGSLISGLGAALTTGNDWLLLAIPVLFLPLYHGMIKREERGLLEMYGDAYEKYMGQVPRYIGWRRGPADTGGFSWRTALVNQEHHTWLALLIFVCLLALRVHLWR